MELNPNTIYKDYINNRLDKFTAIKQLTSIIENYDNDEIREESIKILGKMKLIHENLFILFENLLLSDSNENIRNAGAIYLSEHHLNDSLAVFKWSIQHEMFYQCLFTIVKALVKINSNESKAVLIEQLKKIRNNKYLNSEIGYENKRYKKALKPLIKRNKIITYSHKHLGDILINFFTIKKIIDEIPNVYFELNLSNLLVEKLDLSDYLEFEVKGTPWGWKNNIESLSKITGLKNLLNLQELNLSNNYIKDIKDLVDIKSLIYLDLSNNKISDPQNIEYLKQLPLLEFIDLRGNEIANIINVSDFRPEIRILKESSLRNLEKRFENIK
ncbi:MAG: HEAT repeat domain-containing protein [Candidatus Lokiarchaeota archaeon]|nr:HEAT repeat domain-containing protein [Candidatus Lokiarchaeota archaeon]